MWTAKNRGRYDRSKLRYPSDLTDDEWAHVEPLIPPAKRGGNKRHVEVREVMNGIMYILSTGCQWRAIPKDLPPRSTLFDYLDLWSWDGTLDRICVIRSKPATDSEGSRPLIPIEAGHPVEGGRSALATGDRIAGRDPLCGHARGGPMPAERAPMRKVREVLRLKHALGASEREIAVSVGVSRSTIGEYLRRAAVIGITWPVPAELDDAELERRLFTPAALDGHAERAQPDWNQVHKELKRRGVTLVLLWEEYRAEHGDGYGYSRFCDLYRGWRRTISPTMRQTHGPAEKLFVDFAGDTVAVFGAATGAPRRVQIFVAVLGASNYTFAQARWTQ